MMTLGILVMGGFALLAARLGHFTDATALVRARPLGYAVAATAIATLLTRIIVPTRRVSGSRNARVRARTTAALPRQPRLAHHGRRRPHHVLIGA